MPRTTIADVARQPECPSPPCPARFAGSTGSVPKPGNASSRRRSAAFLLSKARRPWRPAKPCESPCCCRTKSAAGSTPTPSKHLRGDVEGGYDIVPYIVWTQDDLDAFFQNLPGNRNVDAVIEASFDFDEAKKQVLGDLTIPVVGMNAPSTHGLDAGVAIDDEASMATIVRFLKSLGHKTLAYIEPAHQHHAVRLLRQAAQEGIQRSLTSLRLRG